MLDIGRRYTIDAPGTGDHGKTVRAHSQYRPGSTVTVDSDGNRSIRQNGGLVAEPKPEIVAGRTYKITAFKGHPHDGRTVTAIRPAGREAGASADSWLFDLPEIRDERGRCTCGYQECCDKTVASIYDVTEVNR